MLLKYAIIAGLVVLGGMVFYTEINKVLPNTASTMPASLQADAEKIGDDATTFVSERLDETSQTLEQVANDTVHSVAGNVQIVQEQVTDGASALNPIDQIQNVLSNENDTSSNTTTTTTTTTAAPTAENSGSQ